MARVTFEPPHAEGSPAAAALTPAMHSSIRGPPSLITKPSGSLRQPGSHPASGSAALCSCAQIHNGVWNRGKSKINFF